MTLLLTVLITFLASLVEPLAAQESQKIRISYSSRANSTMVYQVALAREFFKEEGLAPEMIQMNPRRARTGIAHRSG